MICPVCARLDQKSRLNQFRADPVKREVERFWDESGASHVHDHTTYRVVLQCVPFNHAFKREWQSRCPQKDCDWNKRPEVLAGEAKIGDTKPQPEPSPGAA